MDCSLTSGQQGILHSRFSLFDPARSASLFAVDQPDDGVKMVQGQRPFPVIRMRSGVWWYPDRANRPHVKDSTAPMKSQAAGKGQRPFTVANLDAAELVVVEGEGHITALTSVGLADSMGLVCVGGVNALARTGGKQQLANTFSSKAVRLFLDPDEAGQAATTKAARAILEAGAARVAMVLPEHLPSSWHTGADVEDWLSTFDDAELALGAVIQLLGQTTWADTVEEIKEQELLTELVQSSRIRVQGDTLPALVVMTYDEAADQTGLAVLAPEGLGHDGELNEQQEAALIKYGDQAEAAEVKARVWRILESWRYGRRLFKPDTSEAVLHYLRCRTLVLPPPPADNPMSSVELWQAIRGFMGRWVHLSATKYYDLLVAYILMSWRLHDALFEHVPYLRFYGPSGSGKGRALAVIRLLLWHSYRTQPTSSNIHRIVDAWGDISLVLDEFHLDRGHSDTSKDNLVDLLNLGNERGQGTTRFDKDARGRMTMTHYELFGVKVFAGYTSDDHEGLARRTVNVPMRVMRHDQLPQDMVLPQLPSEFYAAAEVLRGQLLAWRGRKLPLGAPDATSVRAKVLTAEAGMAVHEAFWPLVEMVPAGMDAELANLMECARSRADAATQARHTSQESMLLEAIVAVNDMHGADLEGSRFIPTAEVAVYLRAEHNYQVSTAMLGKELTKLGFRPIKSRQRRGFLLANSAQVQELFDRYGLDMPSGSVTGKPAL